MTVDVHADVVAAYRERRQGELRLALVGLDGSRLTRIVRRAVLDYYADAGGSLGGDRLDDCVSFVRERMLTEVARYDPALAGGVSVETFVYRRSRPRVIDWLRTKGEGLEFGDARSGAQGRVGLTSDGELEVGLPEDDTLEAAAERLAGGLSERSALTLRIIATAAAEAGGDTLAVLEGMLRDLADELAVSLPDDLRVQLRRHEGRTGEALAAMLGFAA